MPDASDIGGGEVSFNAAGTADELPSHFGAMSSVLSGETSQPDAAALDTREVDPDYVPDGPLQPTFTAPRPRKRARSPSPVLSQGAVSHGPFEPLSRRVQKQRTDPPGAVVVRTDPRGDDAPDETGNFVLIGVALGALVLLWALQKGNDD